MEILIGFLLGLIAHDFCKEQLLKAWTKGYEEKG